MSKVLKKFSAGKTVTKVAAALVVALGVAVGAAWAQKDIALRVVGASGTGSITFFGAETGGEAIDSAKYDDSVWVQVNPGTNSRVSVLTWRVGESGTTAAEDSGSIISNGTNLTLSTPTDHRSCLKQR